MRFCICGGGSLSHVLAGVLASAGHDVNVLTRRPAEWATHIRVLYEDSELRGRLNAVSADPAAVVPGSEIVVVNVPFWARPDILRAIVPHLWTGAWVGSFPGGGGFDWIARSILGDRVRLFGTQRVPYVRRVVQYGSCAEVTGIRRELFVAALPHSEVTSVAGLLTDVLHLPVVPLPNFLCVTLTPTNPIFHPARIFALFGGWAPGLVYEHNVRFYEDWDDDATRIFGACDDEVQSICQALPAELTAVLPIVQHYEVPNLAALTTRIRNIRALRGRLAPMTCCPDGRGFIPDLSSSYFQEDVPYGLVVIRAVAEIAKVGTPMMDRIVCWAQALMGKRFLEEGRLTGPDTRELPLPRHFGISSVGDLIKMAL